MKRHLRKHLGHKPFKCWLCDFACHRKDGLRSHCYRKHEMTEEAFNEMFGSGRKRTERDPFM